MNRSKINQIKKYIVENYCVEIFFILVISIIYRVYAIDIQPLWFDEASTVDFAKRFPNFSDLYKYILDINEPNPIGYFYFFTLLPDNLFENKEIIYRLPSVIFGVGSVLSFFYLFKKHIGSKGGLFGAFLIGILPFYIYYSREARCYSLYVLATIWLISIFYDDGPIGKKSLVFIFSFFIISNCHFGGLVFCFVALAYFLMKINDNKNRIGVFIACLIVSFPSWFQLLYFLYNGLNETLFTKVRHFPKLSFFLVEEFINKAFFYIHTIFLHRPNLNIYLYYLILGLNLIPVLYTIHFYLKNNNFYSKHKFTIAVLLTYIVVFVVASFVSVPLISTRGYLPVIVIFLLLFSQFFNELGYKSQRRVVLLMFSLSLLFNLKLNSFYQLNLERNNYRDSITLYNQEKDKSINSLIVTCSLFGGSIYKMYLTDFYRVNLNEEMHTSCTLSDLNISQSLESYSEVWLFNSGLGSNQTAIDFMESKCTKNLDAVFGRSRITRFRCKERNGTMNDQV